MRKKSDLLTDAELEIMNILWHKDEPISANELLAIPPFKSWSSGYMHNVIRGLIGKDMITVAGMIQSKTQYARTFTATITREEYMAHVALFFVGRNPVSILKVAAAMCEQIGDAKMRSKYLSLICHF